MSNPPKISAAGHWLGVVVCAAGLCGLGCTAAQKATLMGDGFHDEPAPWSDKKRSADSGDSDGGSSGGNLDGVSTKSQQIERDLMR